MIVACFLGHPEIAQTSLTAKADANAKAAQRKA
jgi:hypothetical protein